MYFLLNYVFYLFSEELGSCQAHGLSTVMKSQKCFIVKQSVYVQLASDVCLEGKFPKH